MNKFAKGSIAATAGIVLLLGGVGSLAYWNDAVALDGVAVEAGVLKLDAVNADWADDANEAWVPGNKNEYTAQLQLTAEGKDIKGEIAIDGASYDVAAATAAGFAITLATDGVAKIAKNGGTPTDVTTELTFDEATDTFTFTEPGVYTIPVSVTIELPYGTVADNAAQGATIDFTTLAFTATQAAPDAR